MTVRNPLVRVSGKIIELPAGDALGGASVGPVGMTWQSTWSSSTSYAVDDVVEYQGTSYIAIQAGTNQTPDPAGTAYWDVVALKGDTGATGPTGATGATGSAGASGGDFIKISKVVTSGSQATITFSSIPGSYTNLMLVLSGRDTATGSGNLGVRLQMNGDTTAGNYTQEIFHEELNTSNSGGNNAAASTGFFAGRIPGSLNNANAVGQTTIILADYAGTTFFKTMTAVYGTFFANNAVPLAAGNDFGVWKSTSAITSLVLTAAGTAFVNGTTATLYGMA